MKGFTPTPIEDQSRPPARRRLSWRNNPQLVWGFTLIEIFIVAVIGIILAGTFYFGLSKQDAVQELDLAVSSLASFIRDAEERSRGQIEGVGWGVYFSNQPTGRDFYALFSGPTYTGASSTIYLSRVVEFSDPASGQSKEVAFAKLTGLPSTATTVIMRLVADTATTKTLTIEANGAVSY